MAYSTIKPDPYYSKAGKNFTLEYDPSTGNTRLLESGLLAFGTYPLFENGTFNQTLLNGLGITSQETNSLYANIQTSVLNAYNASGGVANKSVLPPWASAFNQGTTPNTSTTPGTSVQGISQATSGAQGLLNLLGPGLPGIANLNFESQNEKSLFGDDKLLIYPRDLLKEQQDTLQITMYNYKAPLGDAFLNNNSSNIFSNGLQRNSALKDLIGTVILPIPGGIQDNNAISWGDDSMNNLTAGVANYMIKSSGTALAAQLGTGLAGAAAQVGGIQLPIQTINQLATLGAAGISPNNPLVKPAIISQLLKNAGFELPAETILARGAGIVPNSNLELLFQGPTLRQFGFSWRMSPRSEPEARNVKRIIRFFKQGSSPRKQNSQSGAGASSLFLGTPNVFKLSYKTGSQDISGLNKFKICALVNMQTVYAPDGQWAAYDKGQPVSVQMTLNFQEIEPVYESDYQNTIYAGLKNDNPKVNDDDVGY